jgi:hypothetical protein
MGWQLQDFGSDLLDMGGTMSHQPHSMFAFGYRVQPAMAPRLPCRRRIRKILIIGAFAGKKIHGGWSAGRVPW